MSLTNNHTQDTQKNLTVIKGWLNLKNAAKYADVSESTLNKWLHEGLKYCLLPSGHIRVSKAAIDTYLQQFEITENRVEDIVGEILNGCEYKGKG